MDVYAYNSDRDIIIAIITIIIIIIGIVIISVIIITIIIIITLWSGICLKISIDDGKCFEM